MYWARVPAVVQTLTQQRKKTKGTLKRQVLKAFHYEYELRWLEDIEEWVVGSPFWKCRVTCWELPQLLQAACIWQLLCYSNHSYYYLMTKKEIGKIIFFQYSVSYEKSLQVKKLASSWFNVSPLPGLAYKLLILKISIVQGSSKLCIQVELHVKCRYLAKTWPWQHKYYAFCFMKECMSHWTNEAINESQPSGATVYHDVLSTFPFPFFTITYDLAWEKKLKLLAEPD